MNPSFVRVREGRFELDGAPFPVVGANNYYLAYASPAMRGSVIDVARSMSLSVLRAWAFLDCGLADPGRIPPGAWGDVFFQYWDSVANAPAVNGGPNGLERLDHLIADAEAADIRLILPLVNHWPDFGGMDRYVNWFGGGPRDAFYRDGRIRAAFQSYLTAILTRRNTVTGRLYSDEPAILAWELANEPRCETRDGVSVLTNWVSEMSQWIRRSDLNHLIGVGDEGFFNNGRGDLYNGGHGVDFDALLNLPLIDFGTYHMYPEGWGQRDVAGFGVQWIQQHIASGVQAGKPVLLEEYGVLASVDGKPALPREEIYGQWLDAVRDAAGAGDLVWMIAGMRDDGTLYPDYDHYTLYTPDDAPSVRRHALEMRGLPPAA